MELLKTKPGNIVKTLEAVLGNSRAIITPLDSKQSKIVGGITCAGSNIILIQFGGVQ